MRSAQSDDGSTEVSESTIRADAESTQSRSVASSSATLRGSG